MIKKKINKIIIAFFIAVAVVIVVIKNKNIQSEFITATTAPNQEVIVNTNTEIIEAIKNSKLLKYVVVHNAKVVKLLPDDKKGPLHQRWIMEIENGLTITVFHNVDIAERVPLNVGDTLVGVAGELEYGDRWKDPIMHWTHEDPQGQRKAGYVLFHGTTYGRATGP